MYSTALNTPEPVCKTSTTTLDTNHHITITLSSTPNSESKSFPCVQYRDSSKKSFSRTDSQKVKRKSFYELSPDISDKHVQLLENCYGGKKKANHAARVIQQHYRSWIMKKAYLRIRTQSEVRKNSWKGRRIKINLLQSPANNSETLSPITTLPVSHNLSVDGTDSILLNVDRSINPGSPKTKSPEADTLHPKDEFKAIQTDLNIDENFQDVEVRDTGHGEVSVEHMSEDISSIEISKNLLNDSAGQQMIIDEVFHQIMSPRKDSITLGGRQNSFQRKNDNESHKEEKEKVQVLECAPEIMSLSHELEEEIQPVEEEAINKEDAVCKEKSVDQDKVTDLNDNLQISESNVETGKLINYLCKKKKK